MAGPSTVLMHKAMFCSPCQRNARHRFTATPSFVIMKASSFVLPLFLLAATVPFVGGSGPQSDSAPLRDLQAKISALETENRTLKKLLLEARGLLRETLKTPKRSLVN